jgi:SAM-dependent methyltransferase
MITFRRLLLDKALSEAESKMVGRVLDIGGKKENKRGNFRPPTRLTATWKYLNTDATTNPDFCCPAETIPTPPSSFDTVIMTEVLEYIQDPGLVLREIHRIMAPGAICVLTAPFLCPVHGDWEGDRQRFTEIKLRELAEAAGFAAESIAPMGGLGAVIYDLLYTSLGYARPEGKPADFRLRLLELAFPVFRLLDWATRKQRRFINTGYFVTLRCKESD